MNYSYDKAVKDVLKLLKEQPTTAPAPVKPSTPAPTKPQTPSRPHPLTPTKPGISPRPQGEEEEEENVDLKLFVNRRKHRT